MRLPLCGLPLVLTLAACGAETPEGADTADSGDGGTPSTSVLGRCDYENPFSSTPECKEYTGSGWDVEAAQADCAVPVIAADPGQFVEGQACPRDEVVGECLVAGDTETETIIVVPGTDAGACSSAELGCTFAGGVFTPGEVCLEAEESEGVASADAFVPFEQICRDPIEGEEPGDGPDGQVCTWQAISGVTEEGRHFEDYAECSVVVKQRPYWPAASIADTAEDDPRLSDTAWMSEFAWVTEQVEAGACVCCHTDRLAPSGPSGWYLEDGPIWLDGLDDDGLAVLAGWVDSTVFGAFPAEDNNGFSRDQTGIPTNDPDRMQAFLAAELARRGRDQASFAETDPFGGPLYDQLVYEPEPCENGEGVAADGTVTWSGGKIRYLYVLEEGSDNPGVPPNLDMPEGTIWRVDVAHTADPVGTGIAYGEVPDGAWQAWPEAGEPAELVAGKEYYLVGLFDVYQPATRCVFTAGG